MLDDGNMLKIYRVQYILSNLYEPDIKAQWF